MHVDAVRLSMDDAFNVHMPRPFIMAYDVVGLLIMTVDSKSFAMALGFPSLIILPNLSPQFPVGRDLMVLVHLCPCL